MAGIRTRKDPQNPGPGASGQPPGKNFTLLDFLLAYHNRKKDDLFPDILPFLTYPVLDRPPAISTDPNAPIAVFLAVDNDLFSMEISHGRVNTRQGLTMERAILMAMAAKADPALQGQVEIFSDNPDGMQRSQELAMLTLACQKVGLTVTNATPQIAPQFGKIFENKFTAFAALCSEPIPDFAEEEQEPPQEQKDDEFKLEPIPPNETDQGYSTEDGPKEKPVAANPAALPEYWSGLDEERQEGFLLALNSVEGRKFLFSPQDDNGSDHFDAALERINSAFRILSGERQSALLEASGTPSPSWDIQDISRALTDNPSFVFTAQEARMIYNSERQKNGGAACEVLMDLRTTTPIGEAGADREEAQLADPFNETVADAVPPPTIAVDVEQDETSDRRKQYGRHLQM